MKNISNAINTMLHTADLSSEHVDISQERNATPLHAGEEEQAYKVIDHCISTFGEEALHELQQHIEFLQEDFLAHLYARLTEKNLQLDEKLILSLTAENTLFLQCQEHEEALLAALGEDTDLLKRLQDLRAIAFISQGLLYIRNAKEEKPDASLAEYKVCLKGKLSHFYLR